MKNVFITGITGYIGSNTAKKLVSLEYNVFGLIRPTSNLEVINFIDREHLINSSQIDKLAGFFDDNHIDLIIHTATNYFHKHPEDINIIIQDNVILGLNLFEAMTRSKVRNIIIFGTAWQFYNNYFFYPFNFYTVTKQTIDNFSEYYKLHFGIKVLNLYLFDSYGENDFRNKLISNLKYAFDGQCYNLGSPHQKINPVHISDIIEAISYILLSFDQLSKGFNKYAIAYNRFIKLKDLISIVESTKSIKLNITWNKSDFSREVLKPWSEFTILDGWYPRNGLEDTLNFFLNDRKDFKYE